MFETNWGAPTLPDELQMVALVFRHGDRTATSSYPKDVYKEFNYNGLGLGALTRKGVHQMYKLGSNMRQIYKPLFAQEGSFRRHNILARSSDVERAVMSGSAFLAGFYPPPEEDTTLPINWQPIPLYTIPKTDDKLIFVRNCDRYRKLKASLIKNLPEDVKLMMEEDREMLDAFKANTGREKLTYSNIIEIFDTIKIQSAWNLPYPNWFKPEYMPRFDPYYIRYFQLLTETEEMRVLKGGPLISDILNRMINFSNNMSSEKILLYSGHDTTLNSLARALYIDVQTPRLFDFGATLAFELYKAANGLREIRIKFYENSSSTEALDISIPNCSKPCTLQTFAMNYTYLIDKDVQVLCQI